METSYILYEGPSKLDGKPIVVIATGLVNESKNVKTGAMVQTWILRQDMKPTDAVSTGEDYSICGDCQHRGTSCYVEVGRAPNQIWSAYNKGHYEELPRRLFKVFKGRKVRIGAYGDPAAVPTHIWQSIATHAAAVTGYTHQWHKYHARGLRKFCMASIDAVAERLHAEARGFRTFRVRKGGHNLDPLLKGEVICPASVEGGQKLTCEQCLACGGTGKNDNNRRRRGGITIIVHGSKGKVNQFEARA